MAETSPTRPWGVGIIVAAGTAVITALFMQFIESPAEIRSLSTEVSAIKVELAGVANKQDDVRENLIANLSGRLIRVEAALTNATDDRYRKAEAMAVNEHLVSLIDELRRRVDLIRECNEQHSTSTDPDPWKANP